MPDREVYPKQRVNVMIQAQEIKLSKLHPNKGQIAGVPTNPRRATKEQIEKLKKEH